MSDQKSEFQFRPAVREQIRLLLALSGPSGSGKTFSLMKLAKGLAAGKRFAVIDTENGRASMYADYFDFDVLDLRAPFTPERYQDAILASQSAGYEVTLVDSFSHEWEGDGGILDSQDAILTRMVKESRDRGDPRKDWQLEDAHNMRSWNEAKAPHKKLVTTLLQVRMHVLFGLRADDKIEIVKKDGKTTVQPKQSLVGLDGWIPICERRFPFELTTSFMLSAARPGIPRVIKLQEQHKPFFSLDKPITEESGRLIGEWANGGSPVVPLPPKQVSSQPSLVETKPGVYEPTNQPQSKAGDREFPTDASPNPNSVTKNMTLLEMHKAIVRCKAERSLARLGEDIKNSAFTVEERKDLHDVYKAKLIDLHRAAESKTAVDPDTDTQLMDTEAETII